MAVFKSALVATNTGFRPPVIPDKAGELICTRATVALPNTLAAGDLVHMLPLPPECVPVDVILDSDDLDTHGTATITLSVGLLNDDETDLVADTRMIIDSAIGQTGGVARAAVVKGFRTAPHATKARTMAIKVTTVAATKAAGTVGLTMWYRAASFGG